MVVKHIKKEEFQKEVIEADLPVVIDFWAPWCGPCQMMAPVFEELSQEYEGKAKFVKINTDEEPELATQFSIMGIPSFVITKSGKEVERIVGFMPKEVLKQKIDSTISK